MIKKVSQQAEKTWEGIKKVLGALSVWGLIFSVVTISELRVGFDYDDTLVFSTPAYAKGFKSGHVPFSPAFWEVVNGAYDLEKPKILPYALAWTFRVLGFKVAIITSRPDYGAEGLRKEWRHLSRNFVFAGETSRKSVHLKQGNYVAYFGDGDSDITEARKARVPGIRVKRSHRSSFKEDYTPGTLGELILPLSEF